MVLRFLPVWSCSQPSGVKTWAIADALVQIQSPSFPKAKWFSRKEVPLQRSAEALPVRGIRSRPSPREQPTTAQIRCATHELQGSERYGQTVCLGMSSTCWLEVQILFICRYLKLYDSLKVKLALCLSHLKRPSSYDKSSSNNKCNDKPRVDSSLFDAVLETPDDHVPILTREEYVASNLDSIIYL